MSSPIPPILAAVVTIEGKALVIPPKYDFPEICIRSGRTDDLVRIKQKLYWHHPMLALTVLLGLLIYVVLALILRKPAEISYCLTRSERSRFRMWHAANWLIFLSTFGSIVLAADRQNILFIYAALACFVASIVIYFIKVRVVYASYADKQVAKIRGISPAALKMIVSG